MRMRRDFQLGIMAMLLVLVAACQSKRPVMDEAAADAWAKVIVGHTSGLVSRRSEIRLLFASDVAARQALDDNTLSVQPAVPGELALRGTRELVLVPRAELEPGEVYQVTFTGKGLDGLAQDLPAYTFGFRVQTPQFDLQLGALESDPGDDRSMIQRGVIATADAESPATVQAMLRATFRGAPLQPTWLHSGDGRQHEFTLSGIARQTQAAPLQINVAGAPIDAPDSDARTVQVPALGEFAVVDVQASEEDGRKQIVVAFSDALDDAQDTRGLVRLSVEGFTTRIDGNRLVVYPPEETSGAVTVTLEPGLRNRRGGRLATQSVHGVTLASQKPQVRFAGSGTILPDGERMTVAFEVVSAHSVQVLATRIAPDNIPQYLQAAQLGERNYDIGRVGRYLWRKRIPVSAPRSGRWQRHELDVTELMQRHPGAMIQLSLQITPSDSSYVCPGQPAAPPPLAGELPLPRDQVDDNSRRATPWEYEPEFIGVPAPAERDYEAPWRDRNNPCRIGYYLTGYNQAVQAQRNLLATDLGLLAKSDGQGRLMVTVTSLASAEPRSGVALEARNYQNEVVGTATTDRDGMATIQPEGTPFLIVAGSGASRSYLRMGNGNALPVSHFDVGGETVQKGLKGALYGERGVWRPGDAMPLTFVVHDRAGTLPADHPATLELVDPRGRVTQTLVNARPMDGFYRFDARTAPDAPTGNWTARVSLGGATFSRRMKVETVMPNRLRIDLDFGAGMLGGGEPLQGRLESEWLSGASAAGLRADVSLRLSGTTTRFSGFDGFVFDDPSRTLRSEEQPLWSGTLGADGTARVEQAVPVPQAPGMLTAGFTTRVFERGGAFSIHHHERDFAPFARFAGVKLPQMDRRATLPVGESHAVELAGVTASGAPVANQALTVKLYKLDWRWWWDREEGALATFIARESSTRVREGRVSTDARGRALWNFQLAEAQWGRYLLRVCDEQGGHCAGTVFYVDSPYWSESRDATGPAATMLELTTDKESYRVGDTAVIQLPAAAQGRALVTVENGAGILDARWVMPAGEDARVRIPVTAAMTPNAYVSVTLLQPHAGKQNDRPIRLYGVVPLPVTDPATQITPVVQTADEWRPESEVSVRVSEADGKAMTYTLAVVDEGLLGLTGFRTPDLHAEFFRREALGVRTWDLFDDVSGAYGAELARLLALGGSDGGETNPADRQQSRFVPVAQLLGPFQLPAGRTQEQKVRLPRYVGAVRVMVVAGGGTPAAYGSTAKTVPVRQPLMILPTMPRVVGPGEEIAVPVSVFAMHQRVRDVRVTIAPDAMFEVVGSPTAQLAFASTGEQIAMLRLRVTGRLGPARVRFEAVSGNDRAQDEISIEVRSPNPPHTRTVTQMLQPGAAWQHRIAPHGMPGTNEVALEVSTLPALNLERRLNFLVAYPYGGLEQTVSGAFPQLLLPALVTMDEADRARAEANARAAIERLRSFQHPQGGFSYWPGGAFVLDNGYHQWSAIYAGHFLLEAERLGHAVPAALRADLLRFLHGTARDWRPARSAPLQQAYRLFVLARGGEPEVGAMNRLRELPLDPVERWVLAGAYHLAGLGEAAQALADVDPLAGRDPRRGDSTFGTPLRDHALVLQSMVVMGQLDRAAPLVQRVAQQLGSDMWLSTQETAYSLLSLSQLAGARPSGTFGFSRTVGTQVTNVTSTASVHREALTSVPDAGAPLVVRNTSDRILFATVTVRGTPLAGNEEAAASGLSLTVGYSAAAGLPVDISRLPQGEDVTVDLVVRNLTREAVRHIALTQIVPSGWEIANERLFDAGDATGERDADNPREAWRQAAAAATDHVDIRDDRVMQFFDLPAGATIRFQTRINAAYRGRFYLPGVLAEAMYDASINARTAGRWTEVVAR